MEHPIQENEFSFKGLFVPFTTLKAIHWIVFIGLIVLFNGLFNGFLGDDTSQIIINPLVHSLSNIPAFFAGGSFYNTAVHSLSGSYLKPLLDIAFTIIYALSGGQPFLFHLVQILLHIINACILLFVLKRFFKLPLAFFLSVIFLVHPLNSETALYISALQDTLFFFFGIIAFLLATKLQKTKELVLIFTFLLCSLLSKETGALFLIILPIYTSIYNRKRLVYLLATEVGLFVLYLFLRLSTIGFFHKPVSVPIADLSLLGRVINIPWIFALYIINFFFPAFISSSYQEVFTKIDWIHFYLPLFIDVIFFAAIGLLFYAMRKTTLLTLTLFFFLWFIVGMAIHMQIIPLDYSAANRWFYFPIVGLLGILGIGVEVSAKKLNKKILMSVFIVAIIALSLRTFVRTFDWRDELTLDSHDLLISKNDFNLENQLALALVEQGRGKEAKPHVERSIQLYPNFSSYNTLGMVDASLREYGQAEQAYLSGIKLGKSYIIYDNLSLIYLVYGDRKKNIASLEDALKYFPNDSKLWLYLSILEYKDNHIDLAKKAISNAYSLNQNSQQIQYVYYRLANNLPLQINIDPSQY